jgi:hypothetical protein
MRNVWYYSGILCVIRLLYVELFWMLNLAVYKINDWALKADLTGVCDGDKECSLWSGNLPINVARMNITSDWLHRSIELCSQFFICSKAEEFHGRCRPTCQVAGTCRCVLPVSRCVREQSVHITVHCIDPLAHRVWCYNSSSDRQTTSKGPVLFFWLFFWGGGPSLHIPSPLTSPLD